ncbi:MAG: glycosyltransferase family 39 protein [Chloroflexota bacterium]
MNVYETFDTLYVKRPTRWLLVILVAYAIVAVGFAIQTPRWQAPDEPAHYNYIAHIANELSLPVLKLGDYNHTYLGQLVTTRFPPNFSVASLRYESYQPPLYYLTAAPIFWLSDGRVLILRLYNVFIGALTLIALYRTITLIFPKKHLIGLTATAFAALLPMHVAMDAAINNDGFAELLVITSLLILLTWMKAYMETEVNGEDAVLNDRRTLILLGIVLGLGLLTKIYAYAMVPISALAIVLVTYWRHHLQKGEMRSFLLGVQKSLWTIVPAILLGLPLWIRNLRNYGGLDFLGLQWHDKVVIGQPTTESWINTFGWVAYWERAFSFTFKSFWGVFGWLAVFMDERIYTMMLVFTGVLFLGWLWSMVRFISGKPDSDLTPFQVAAMLLLVVVLLAVTASYIWYNTKFVQHQGRYFFWGLVAISTIVALGWRELLHPLQGTITAFLAFVLAVALGVTGTINGSLDKWAVLFISMVGALLLLQPLLLSNTDSYTIEWLPQPIRTLIRSQPVSGIMTMLRLTVWMIPFLFLFLLDLLIPIVYIMPQTLP